ncbi:MAG TPA: glycosyl hydrolase family 28-related protein, partial [Isosphaeraceae bacterium]|nr:glycosyl hydrolase family 28-related protein [Isosphaeraceae bacterium]
MSAGNSSERVGLGLPVFVARFVLAACLLPQASSTRCLAAADVVFPADAGVVNVRDHGAKGDGRHDDTAAIQNLLDARPSAGRIIYMPNGVYVISDTIKWPYDQSAGRSDANTILQGQSEMTVIRLKDGCAGFSDPEHPRAMLRTGSAPRNAVCDLTLDAGRRNPGAIGLEFIASDQGCVRNVVIRAADGKGHVGLDMSFSPTNGSSFVKNLRVVGFDFGIRVAHLETSVTFEQLRLDQQSRFGLVNEGACVSMSGIESHSASTAILNSGPLGHMVLLGARLFGGRGALAKPAVLNEGTLYARGVEASGYQEAIRNAASDLRPEVSGRKVVEFVSHRPLELFPSNGRSLNLPVRETPEVPWDDLRDWASPTHFGARPSDDADYTKAIQQAIDSGKTTVYFPHGSYRISDTLLVRNKVRRIIGCEAQVTLAAMGDKPAFRVEQGTSPTVVFERIDGGAAEGLVLENSSGRTLVVKDCRRVAWRMTGKGDIFLENMSSGASARWSFGGQHVWARQLSLIGDGPMIQNGAGTLWILGLRARGGGTLIETTAGGQTELLGGLCECNADSGSAPMFRVVDSHVSFSIAEVPVSGRQHDVLVSETRKGDTKTLNGADAPARDKGR